MKYGMMMCLTVLVYLKFLVSDFSSMGSFHSESMNKAHGHWGVVPEVRYGGNEERNSYVRYMK